MDRARGCREGVETLGENILDLNIKKKKLIFLSIKMNISVHPSASQT